MSSKSSSTDGEPVDLYIYDLTQGLAAVLSPAIIGRQIEGVWHTSLVVYGREYYYGAGGIACEPIGSTLAGRPLEIQRLGVTQVPLTVFREYLQGLGATTFSGSAYQLLSHNCNHFTDEVAQFLCGARVPKHIVRQPDTDLPPALRAALAELLGQAAPRGGQNVSPRMRDHTRGPSNDPPARPETRFAATPIGPNGLVRPAFDRQDSPEYLTLNSQIEEARTRFRGLYHRLLVSVLRSALRLRAGAGRGAGPERARELAAGVVRRAGLLAGALVLRAAAGLRAFYRRDPPVPRRVQSAELEQRRSTLADKLARKERRREKKRRKQGLGDQPDDMAEAAEPVAPEPRARAGPSSDELDERRAEELRRRARDPPITYKDLDGAQEFAALTEAIGSLSLTPEEHQSLGELEQYLVHGEGSWALGDEFLAFIGRLLGPASSEAARVATLRCVGAMALRDDVSLLLHQDRRDHALMNYAHGVERLPPAEQLALATALCNLFENISSSEWLLYISEWEMNGQPVSNIRVTTKVAVHATLSEDAELREVGTALMYNMATKEVKTVRLSAGRALRDLLPRQAKSKVFDDVSVELAMALLQLLQSAPAEELLFRAVAALARLAHHSADVAQLVPLVGPVPTTFRGTSPRCDEKIDLIMQKVKLSA